jgi:hypothetical protein
MLGLLIPFFGVLATLTIAALARNGQQPLERRGALIGGMLLTGVWATAGSELLSVGHHLRFWPVLAWWTIPSLFLGLWLTRCGMPRTPRLDIAELDAGSRLMLAAVAIFLLVSLPIAALYPTTTWDCWVYHLPRQFYWIAYGSVDHFPAHHVHQLQMPPMAEYLGVQWMLLSAGDGWGNMHQWFATLGCTIAASLTARELGARARGQCLAALLVVASGAVMTQAVNGKNDILTGFWILTLAWLGARTARTRSAGFWTVFAIGSALGLALLTKGTAYIIGLPVGAATGLALLRIHRARAIPAGLAILVIAGVLNLGHWSRSYESFGSPLGYPRTREQVAVTIHTPASILSGIVKNLAMHTASPSEEINAATTRTVERFHDVIGFDVNHPDTTSLANFPFTLRWSLVEDGNGTMPAQLVLALFLLGVAAARPSLIRTSPGVVPFLVPYAAFVCFAAMLKWQPWQHRLEIPIALLLAPVAGCILPRVRLGPMKMLIVWGGVALAWTNLLLNLARPLTGPSSIFRHDPQAAFFASAGNLRTPLEQVAARVGQLRPRSVAHALGLAGKEYPLIRSLRQALPGVPIFPLNPNFGPGKTPAPDVVIAWDVDGTAPLLQRHTNIYFTPVATYPPFSIFIDASKLPPPTGSEIPAFYGWQSSEGLSPPQGPFPKLDLPVVRWARELRTVLRFESPGGTGELFMDCRRNGRNDQRMVVSLNGQRLYEFRFGGTWRFFTHRVELPTRPGGNELVIEYAQLNEPGPRQAVQYKQLQILVPKSTRPSAQSAPESPPASGAP